MPADRNTTWLSPEESGERRLCIDMTYTNTCIKQICYEIPSIDGITHELNRATVFSKFDLKQAYH